MESFQTYYKLLKTQKDIQINFIFSVPVEGNNSDTQIVKTILHIYLNESKEKAFGALNDWFQERTISKWQNKYKMPVNFDNRIVTILKAHQNWLNVNHVYHTPATMVDNYYYPKAYNINDLLLFVDDMLLEQRELILETI